MTTANLTFADRFNIIFSHQAIISKQQPKVKKQKISSEKFNTSFVIGNIYSVRDYNGISLCTISYTSRDLNDKEFKCDDLIIPKGTILLYLGVIKYDFVIKDSFFSQYSIYGLEFLYDEQIVFSVVIYKETQDENIDIFFSEAEVRKKLLNSLKGNLEICQ